MTDECLFCRIIGKKRDADIVYENETLIAFKDRHPHAPVHLLIVPRKHIRSVNDLAPEDKGIVGEMVMKAPEIAKLMSVDRSGYKLQINVERGAGQVVFHLHMHLTAGWQ